MEIFDAGLDIDLLHSDDIDDKITVHFLSLDLFIHRLITQSSISHP